MNPTDKDLHPEEDAPLLSDFREYLPGFIESAREHIDAINQGLLHLEKEGAGDTESLSRISRNAHSLKGAAMTMGMGNITSLCHQMEDIIREIREQKMATGPETFDVLFQTNDGISAMVERLSHSSVEDTSQLNGLFEKLAALRPTSDEPLPSRAISKKMTKNSEMPLGKTVTNTVRVPTEKVDRFLNIAVELVILRNRMQILQDQLDMAGASRKKEQKLLSVMEEDLPETSVSQSSAHFALKELVQQQHKGHQIVAQFGENFLESMEVLNQLVTETQQLVMDIRMLPVSMLFNAFTRPVRDLARQKNKKVELIIQGEETRIDKRAIEELSDPLMHLLRNAIDHGIESPEERKQRSKEETGTIIIRAFQDIDKVMIEIRDDGRGIDKAQIKMKALEKGFLLPDEAKRLLDDEVFDLLFLQGFSTAAMVTELSGRGIGMEVVKDNVEKLNGSVEITSVPGESTKITISVPLTLATTRAFLVRCSGHILAIPVFSAIQVLRASPDSILVVKGREAVYLKGEIVPCARLDLTLSFPQQEKEDADGKLSLILLRQSGKKIAFQVDEVVGVEEIVMRNLGTHLRRLPAFSGSSILGTGEIALIIDVPRLFTTAQIKAGNIFQERSASFEKKAVRQRILLVEDQMTTRLLEKSILEAAGFEVEMAVDGFEAINRLEENPYDLVITDVQMPRMDGFTLTSTLKNDDRFSHLPVIIVTSLESESEKTQGLQAGADAFLLKKSFNQESLIQTIKTLIG
ncbi:MAG: hybrid sensor histidine kinase/response regulator [Desulfatirhabdiaceae bacterium]